MSRIYFHSPSATVEVLGSERAWLGSLTDDIGLSLVDGFAIRNAAEWLAFDFGDGRGVADLRYDAEVERTAKLMMRHRSGSVMTYRGLPLSAWDISLNTALRLGSDPVKLAARIHAQCEIHGWVDGPNRAWMADLIDRGLASGVFRLPWGPDRRDPGWRGVVDFLRSTDAEPVVMSYSVTEQFPNAYASTWMPEWPEGVEQDWEALTEDQQAERSEAWYDLDSSEQWERGMTWLRTPPQECARSSQTASPTSCSVTTA